MKLSPIQAGFPNFNFKSVLAHWIEIEIMTEISLNWGLNWMVQWNHAALIKSIPLSDFIQLKINSLPEVNWFKLNWRKRID